jgi:hypothetical protein|uniref:Uncharacterized protein n=1 Tax=viral metagenome TaxID=1070528 RepID=A0A6C0J5B9_9ZZZZ
MLKTLFGISACVSLFCYLYSKRYTVVWNITSAYSYAKFYIPFKKQKTFLTLLSEHNNIDIYKEQVCDTIISVDYKIMQQEYTIYYNQYIKFPPAEEQQFLSSFVSTYDYIIISKSGLGNLITDNAVIKKILKYAGPYGNFYYGQEIEKYLVSPRIILIQNEIIKEDEKFGIYDVITGEQLIF